MDNPSINIQSKYCQKHNQPILYYDQNGRNPQCQVCMLEKGKLITIEQIQEQYQEKINNNIKENDFQLQQLQTLMDGILKYKENIIQSLNKSIQQISDQIKSIQQQKQSMQQLDKIRNKYESFEDFTSFINNNQKTNRQFKNQILKNLLLDFKQNIMKIDFLNSILNLKQQISAQTLLPKINKTQEVISDQKKSLQQIEYELIQSLEIDYQYSFSSFAIDSRNNFLIVGLSNGRIKIFNFQNGLVGAEIQSLKAHTDDVECLYCMKNAFCFVSGSRDKSIIIWQFDKDQKWKVQQTLSCQPLYVNCIIMNSKEDLLISGLGYESSDGYVNFWMKLSKDWCLFQTIKTGKIVNSLSLNENEDKLIAAIGIFEIREFIVMVIKSNQHWKYIQSIQVYGYGYSLCFTIQDQFVFQPNLSNYLEIYYFDKAKGKFQQKSRVLIKQLKNVENSRNSQICQFIKKLDILAVQRGQFLNILKVNQNGEYRLIQSIECKGNYEGKMTDDGEYLIKYDFESNKTQVWQLKVKEGLS